MTGVGGLAVDGLAALPGSVRRLPGYPTRRLVIPAVRRLGHRPIGSSLPVRAVYPGGSGPGPPQPRLRIASAAIAK